MTQDIFQKPNAQKRTFCKCLWWRGHCGSAWFIHELHSSAANGEHILHETGMRPRWGGQETAGDAAMAPSVRPDEKHSISTPDSPIADIAHVLLTHMTNRNSSWHNNELQKLMSNGTFCTSAFTYERNGDQLLNICVTYSLDWLRYIQSPASDKHLCQWTKATSDYY